MEERIIQKENQEIEAFTEFYRDAQKLFPKLRRTVKLTAKKNVMIIKHKGKIIIKVEDDDVGTLYRLAKKRLEEWMQRDLGSC